LCCLGADPRTAFHAYFTTCWNAFPLSHVCLVLATLIRVVEFCCIHVGVGGYCLHVPWIPGGPICWACHVLTCHVHVGFTLWPIGHRVFPGFQEVPLVGLIMCSHVMRMLFSLVTHWAQGGPWIPGGPTSSANQVLTCHVHVVVPCDPLGHMAPKCCPNGPRKRPEL